MWAVFVPNADSAGKWYEGLGNAWHPVAWFDSREAAVEYVGFLGDAKASFALAAYLPEDYVTGTGYVGEVVR